MAADTQEILRELRKAKAAHIKWRSYANGMLAGLDIGPEYSPVEPTDCAFGKWYYGEGKDAFGDLDTYSGIAVPHQILHKIYAKIFELAKKGKLKDAEAEVARLNELSRQVLEALDLLEREAGAGK